MDQQSHLLYPQITFTFTAKIHLQGSGLCLQLLRIFLARLNMRSFQSHRLGIGFVQEDQLGMHLISIKQQVRLFFMKILQRINGPVKLHLWDLITFILPNIL